MKPDDVSFDCSHHYDPELIPDLLRFFDCPDKQSLYAILREALVWADEIGLLFMRACPAGSTAMVGRPIEEGSRFSLELTTLCHHGEQCHGHELLCRAVAAALYKTHPLLRRAAEAQRDETFPEDWFPDPDREYYVDHSRLALE